MLSSRHSPSSSHQHHERRGQGLGPGLGQGPHQGQGLGQGYHQGQGLGQHQGQGLATRPRIFFPPTPKNNDNDNDNSGIEGVGTGIGVGTGVGTGVGKGIEIGVGKGGVGKESGTGGNSPTKSVSGISANVRRGRRVRSTYDATTSSPDPGTSGTHHLDMGTVTNTTATTNNTTMAISSAPSSFYTLPKASSGGNHPGTPQSNIPVKHPSQILTRSHSNLTGTFPTGVSHSPTLEGRTLEGRTLEGRNLQGSNQLHGATESNSHSQVPQGQVML